MKPFDIGFDADAIVRSGGHGRVRAVFSRAVYVDLPAGLFAVTTGAVARGPLHVRVPALPIVAPGDAVIAERAALPVVRFGDARIVWQAPVWRAELPLLTSRRTAATAASAWCQVLSVELSHEPFLVDRASCEALRRADLSRFGKQVVGRGPGLTPVGDDVLAGVLLVACAIGCSNRGGPGCDGMFNDIVAAGMTNDIALAFLRCAADGRCIEPAHEFLRALAQADHQAAHRVVGRLRQFGSSSGIALAYGIALALVALPSSRSDQVAAPAARMVNAAIG